MVSGVFSAGSGDIRCELWEPGSGAEPAGVGQRPGLHLAAGLGCLAGVAAHRGSAKIGLGGFVLGKAFPLLCVLWTSLALKT